MRSAGRHLHVVDATPFRNAGEAFEKEADTPFFAPVRNTTGA